MRAPPKGWIETTLGQIAQWGSGGTPSRRDPANFGGTIPWIKTGELGQRFVNATEENISERGLNNSSAKLFPTGSVAIAMYGATIGKASILGIEAATNQACAVAIPDFNIATTEFLYYYLCSQRNSFVDAGKGGAQPNISQSVLKSWLVPLPPLPEQKRIADKLDRLLGRVDACRERLDRIPAILKRFRQSVLAAATSGELTREWREARGMDTCNWTETTVGRLVERIEAGLNVQCEERPPESNERGLVKISAVTWGRYDDNESKTLPCTAEVPERSRVMLGDFLISRANTLELVGACVIVEQVTRPVYLSDKVLRLVMPEGLKRWILIALQSPEGRKAIESRASGNQLSMRNLSQANLREIRISIPPEDEMAEAVDRVRRLLDVAEQIARRAVDAAAVVQRSVPATLAKAFRGELVPQDPNDEPAAALLARIAAARQTAGEASGGKARRRKGGRHAHAD